MLKLPVIRGVIDRRILVNYRVDPARIAPLLPAPFRPRLVEGRAMAGICLIRLKRVRPRWSPLPWGVGSENAAHRIAVEWDDPAQPGGIATGVYIPRRDSNSRFNALVGGRVFPGAHHLARFDVEETDERLRIEIHADDPQANVQVTATVAEALNADSIYGTLDNASRFFETGALGFSPTRAGGTVEGLELRCQSWRVQPLTVESAHSGFFSDLTLFPSGSATLDCALLMRGIEHEWHASAGPCCP